MTTTPSLPDYSEFANALQHTKSKLDPSQLHGLFCGYIVAAKGENAQHWETILQGANKVPEIRELLQQLFEISFHQMSEFSFEFTLLLPDDSVDIKTRTECLGLWCQGFLTGLEQFKIPLKSSEESEVAEAINDLLEISQVSFDDTTDNDEDETAYFELVEYVRLAVLMLFQELKGPETDTAREENTLH